MPIVPTRGLCTFRFDPPCDLLAEYVPVTRKQSFHLQTLRRRAYDGDFRFHPLPGGICRHRHSMCDRFCSSSDVASQFLPGVSSALNRVSEPDRGLVLDSPHLDCDSYCLRSIRSTLCRISTSGVTACNLLPIILSQRQPFRKTVKRELRHFLLLTGWPLHTHNLFLPLICANRDTRQQESAAPKTGVKPILRLPVD